jgi:hypothetical protein
MTPTNLPVVYKLAVFYRSYILESITAPSSGWPHERLRNMQESHTTVLIVKCILDAFVGVTSEKFDTDCVLCERENKVLDDF